MLIAANPAVGELREHRLAEVTVAPGTETAVTINVADFPVQRVGEATSVSIGLRWKRQDLQADMVSPQAVSEPLFVTHDDDSFRTAVLREHDAELARHLVGTTHVKASERRLRRAVALTGAKRFELLDRLDAPIVAVSTLVEDQTSDIQGRQP